MITLTAGQGIDARRRGLIEGRDFVSYEQVPLGSRDLICVPGTDRWIDRRTTDGEVLAADGRNARD